MKRVLSILFFSISIFAQQGYMGIDTIENNNVSYFATSSYTIDLLKVERLIYQDGKLFNKKILDCGLKGQGFQCFGYFPKGHDYRIEILNPKTRELIFTALEFKME